MKSGGIIRKSTSLYFKEGSSDKEYHIQLVDLERGRYIVNFQYGRRGSSLKDGTKTEAPVSLFEAENIFASLKREKMRKGYEPDYESEVDKESSKSKESKDVKKEVKKVEVRPKTIYFLPQLLNPIEDAQSYIDDDNYLAQEKKDGERRMIIVDDNGVKGLNKKGEEVSVSREIINSISDNCILDGEIVGNTLYVFDILSLYKKDLTKKSCAERNVILNTLSFGNSVIIVETTYTKKGKQKLFDKLKSERREGIVFKNINSPYTIGRPSSGGNQLKFKFYKTATFIVANATNNKRSVGLELIDNKTKQRVFMGKVTIPPNYDVPAIGDLVEVRYLYAYRGGAIYQPVYLGKRNDSDLTDATMNQIVFKADDFEYGGSISLLSSQEVENKLGRELHWWNDDIVYLSGIEYKKVYLRPEYKKI